METIWEGHIAGPFEGYANGRMYELTDGSRWRQEDRWAEYVDREQATAKLLWDQSCGITYLDVEGTSRVVKVVADRGMSGMGWGAFVPCWTWEKPTEHAEERQKIPEHAEIQG